MKKVMDWILNLELRGGKVIVVFTIFLTLLGGLLGHLFLTSDWSEERRLAAGALGGLGAAVIVIMSRWVGAYSETEQE
jgi:hypothetical protein